MTTKFTRTFVAALAASTFAGSLATGRGAAATAARLASGRRGATVRKGSAVARLLVVVAAAR